MSRSASGQFSWLTEDAARAVVALPPTGDSYGDRLAAVRALMAIERQRRDACPVCGRCREICAHRGGGAS